MNDSRETIGSEVTACWLAAGRRAVMAGKEQGREQTNYQSLQLSRRS